MNKLLESISVKKSRLDKLLAKKNNQTVLNNWLCTELTYTSNAIEGNTLTRRETQLAINEDITSGSKPIKDYIEAKNHSNAYKFILDAISDSVRIDEKLILEIHRKILSGIDDENAGRYRNVRVRISGSNVILPNYMKVPELMSEFDKWLKSNRSDSINMAIQSHFRLVSIHPFVDGNGRTARLLMNMILMQAGYAPIIIRKIDRRRYLSGLEKYQLSNDSEQYEKFMLGALSKSLSMAIDLLDKDMPDTGELLTIAKFAKLVNLPTSTIRYWVSQNKLKPIAYTASGYMLFDKDQVHGFKKPKP